MKNYLIFIGLWLLAISSCTTDFKEINTNPNAPVDVQPSLLLRQVIYNYGEELSYEGFVAGNLLGQYFTAIDFNLFDRHSLSEPQFGGNPWPVLYTNLRDNELMLGIARNKPALAIYEGPGLILKSYLTAALTDIYGDVPYSQALAGLSGQVTPIYDSQEHIYTGPGGILDNLDQGITILRNHHGVLPLEGDILFDGELEGWIKFANSLKIKYLMRISGRVDVMTELQSIYDEGDFLKVNVDNAVFNFTDNQPNNFRMANLRAGDFNLFVMSATIEEVFEQLKDPRKEVFFRPFANDPLQSHFSGLLNGPDASQTSISVADYSLAGIIFREKTADLKANFMTSWETWFLLAEAAEKEIIDADAKILYEEGVKLAFEYWYTDLPEDYLEQGMSAFGFEDADKLEQIITQKWIANIINGYEGWIEYRRTGFPRLKTISASLNNDLIPVRMPYPADEEVLNHANFIKATANHDNSINARVWWDVK